MHAACSVGMILRVVLEAAGRDPIQDGYICDLARSFGRHANTRGGFITCNSTGVKLYDFSAHRCYEGHELLAFQGFDVSRLDLSGHGYAFLNLLAGRKINIACHAVDCRGNAYHVDCRL